MGRAYLVTVVRANGGCEACESPGTWALSFESGKGKKKNGEKERIARSPKKKKNRFPEKNISERGLFM